MRLSIRSKLIMFTVLPVVVVYSLLFVIGVAHVRDQHSSYARDWLAEHARHQASRLALLFSQAPALAEGIADLVLADPGQSQALLYAHLIDGLRRTPIAHSAAVSFGDPPRSALMRRGARSGELVAEAAMAGQSAGWHIDAQSLRFNRQIYRQGQRYGQVWVELPIAGIYAELAKQQSDAVRLFVNGDEGRLLTPRGATAETVALADALQFPAGTQRVETSSDANGQPYWAVSAQLPGFPWRITAVTPTATALASARHEVGVVAMALTLSLAAIILIIGLVARRITRPLKALDDRVNAITRGEAIVAPTVSTDDELGRLTGAIGRMAREIDDRERQLRHSQEVLEQRVEQRTAALSESNRRLLRQVEETRKTQTALEHAKEQAQQASRAKSEFLSNMSHELRTPLHGVLGYAQILRRDAATSATHRESLEAIERCGQHLLILINDILDLTKIEAGQLQADIQPVDLRQLIGDVHMIIAQRALNKGLQLNLELAPDLPGSTLTDGVKLKQILLNLLGNAVKFTARGSVTLYARPDGADRVMFEVVDTGIGIEAEKIDSIFDAFSQAREGQVVDGTGLGLAINQRLISLLGGETLPVDSTPGVGSRFCFHIPYRRVEADPLPTTSAAPAAEPQLPPDLYCRILVVDATEEGRNMLAGLLDGPQCQVMTAETLEVAHQSLQQQAFDLVLIDVRVPDDVAQEAASELRLIATGEPRIVAVSATPFPNFEGKARQVGFDAFLAKPFDHGQLVTTIAALLHPSEQPGSAAAQIPSLPPQIAAAWPEALAIDSAARMRAAIELGDIGSLIQLAEELSDNPAAPRADVENLALMTRLFDFDGLRQLSQRIHPSDETTDADA